MNRFTLRSVEPVRRLQVARCNAGLLYGRSQVISVTAVSGDIGSVEANVGVTKRLYITTSRLQSE